MAKNKKHKAERENALFGIPRGMLRNLKTETIHGVVAVLFFTTTAFLILSPLDKAGMVGESFYAFFSFLLGIGYFLLPLISLTLGISFLQKQEPGFATTRMLGAVLFFAAGLGIIELVATEKGGVVGSLISSPLVKLFDVYVSGIFLSAILVISFLIIFDTHLPTRSLLFLFRMFKKSHNPKEDGAENEIKSPPNSGTEDIPQLAEEDSNEEAGKEYQETEDITPEKIFDFEKYNTNHAFQDTKNAPKKTANLVRRDIPPYPKALRDYIPPPLSLLEGDRGRPGVGDIKANANIIKRTLQNFGITVEMDEISIGPSVTRYALKPAEGVKLSRIVGLQDNLALALAAHPLRIEAPIPGKSLVGIEIPNTTKTTVGLASLLASEEFQKSNKPLLIALGRSTSNKSHFADLDKMPHLLIAVPANQLPSILLLLPCCFEILPKLYALY
jgi:S-DNA-T family DNA segregation ATPase FtsK/SpoIIIE